MWEQVFIVWREEREGEERERGVHGEYGDGAWLTGRQVRRAEKR